MDRDYDSCDFMVNDGKCGSVGKFMVTEFDPDDECAKDTESMIRSKFVRFITRRDKEAPFASDESNAHCVICLR